MTLPGRLTQLRLLFELRIASGLNARRSGRLAAALAYALTASPGLVLALGMYRLERLPVIARTPWGLFVLTLGGFVTTCLFLTWPLLSAGVDDHGELSRFASFPLSSRRLVLSSVLASIVEPRAITLTGPLVGAAAGFASVHLRPSIGTVALFVVGLVGNLLMNAAWSRAVAHAALNVLKDKRSAELIGGGFVLFLFATSFIPPVDTRWLTETSGTVLGRIGADRILQSAIAMLYVPSGFFPGSLLLTGIGHPSIAIAQLVALWFTAWIGLVVAHRLLLRFYRRARGQPARPPSSGQDPFGTARSLDAALLWREVLDLWRNPRARLLAAVPFVLSILLRLLSAPSLAHYALGAKADAALIAALALYGAMVMTSTFSQNAFGYDGRSFAALLASPVPLGRILRVKNRAHAASGLLLAAATLVYDRIYFGAGSTWDLLCVALGVTTLVPTLLLAGNFLSVFFPVRFHETLERRDRLPLTAVSLGMTAASIGASPLVFALRRFGPSPSAALLLLGSTALAWFAYRLALPLSMGLLERRREEVLAAVGREVL